MTNDTLAVDAALDAIAEDPPLVNAYTNSVTVNDVAQAVLHWGGLPVMSEDRREAADMVGISGACLLNVGTVDEQGEERMMTAGRAAERNDVPVVLDPVGAGATPMRDRVAEQLADELDVAVVKGNYGEITALTGEEAEVRGVESVGEYGDVATTAVACAQQYDAVVVASGEVDVVATADAAYEVAAGDPNMGTVVGTGCMLGATVATFAGAMDAETAALTGTAAFGLAGEAAADGQFGDFDGPASYHVAFEDAIAGLGDADHDPVDERVERVLSAGD